MIVVAIGGKARSGKDTFGDTMKTALQKADKRVIRINYADYLKFIASEYYGWDGEKDEKGRTFLQQLGTNFRTVNREFLVQNMLSLLIAVQNDFDYAIIADCRYPNEIDELKKHFSVLSIRINRTDYENGLTAEQKMHPTETAMDGYPFKCDIDNRSNDISQLRGTATGIAEDLLFYHKLLKV